MYSRAQAGRRWSAHGTCDEPDAERGVDGWLVLCEHDQCGTALVEPRVHATGDLDPAGQGEPYVDVVGHLVRPQRRADLPGDLLVGRDPLEREGRGRTPQPGQMLVQLEDPALVEPAPL